MVRTDKLDQPATFILKSSAKLCEMVDDGELTYTERRLWSAGLNATRSDDFPKAIEKARELIVRVMQRHVCKGLTPTTFDELHGVASVILAYSRRA